jgi:hypothetical protein
MGPAIFQRELFLGRADAVTFDDIHPNDREL